ncbi:1490_t:CDS:2 [Ambispora gerdemannii]|uniref:1490_t:CDS:1 n=1 Tax=Ambispora gerdemannii TaxID=144530 RepID=A0A9N9D1D5_9GLOM|nr:1490_t:CDS:2 [Ambispora gerdemannii]
MSQNEKLFSIWFSAFGSARHKLLAIRQEGSEEVKRKGIIIDRNILRNTYLKFCEEEPKVSVNHRLIDGKIEAYEMPLDPHGLVHGELNLIMGNWSRQSVCRPDICVRPLNRHQPQSLRAVNSSGNPYPTLVVEIGNTETIKLYPTRQDGTFALLALLYLRNNQNPTILVIAKSFGTAPLSDISRTYLLNTIRVPANMITGVDDDFGGIRCDHANMPEYQIYIPTILLFNDVPGCVPGDVPNNFIIDLWRLQDAILTIS